MENDLELTHTGVIIAEEINIKSEDALVQEELKFSHTQSSKTNKQRDIILEEISEKINYVPKSNQELLHDVIISIAMEQRAVAQFIQAEAKHVQAYINTEHELRDLANFQSDIVRIVEGLVEKQKMSMRMLDMTKMVLKEE